MDNQGKSQNQKQKQERVAQQRINVGVGHKNPPAEPLTTTTINKNVENKG